MRIPIRLRLPVLRRRGQQQGESQPPAATHHQQRQPRIIVVGSDRGGRGKSTISTSLTVATAAVLKLTGVKKYVILIDTDIDAASSAKRFYTFDDPSRIGTKFASFASFVLSMSTPDRLYAPVLTCVACDSSQIRLDNIILIPPYDISMSTRIHREWRVVRHEAIHHGMAHMMRVLRETYLHPQGRYPGAYTAIIDLKPKSYTDIRDDPMFVAVHYADLYIHVETPDSLFEKTPESFISKYGEFIDKMVLVVNRVKLSDSNVQDMLLDYLYTLASEGLRRIFIYPESKLVEQTFRDRFDIVARRLDTREGQYMLALAAFAGIVDPSVLDRIGCRYARAVYEKMLRFNEMLAGGGA